ncbi:MAG: hypothetical protein ACMUIE_05325 [Thermoplasmatota archaeon]
MDQGATKEYSVAQMSLKELQAKTEGALVRKGFKFTGKENFHSSVMIYAQKGSLAKSYAAHVLTDGLSNYFESTSTYLAEAEISERGAGLRFRIAISPRSAVYNRGDLLAVMDRPLLNLTIDNSSMKILDDILDIMGSMGVRFQPVQEYGYQGGYQTVQGETDRYGWRIDHGPELPQEDQGASGYSIAGLVLGIIGLVGFLVLILTALLPSKYIGGLWLPTLCFAGLLSLMAFPGIGLSYTGIMKDAKESRMIGFISLIMSAVTILGLFIMAVILLSRFTESL